MQLGFDATRFGLGLQEAVELAGAKRLGAVEYAFGSFDASGKSVSLSKDEKKHLQEVKERCSRDEIEISCLRLDFVADLSDKASVKQFQQMLRKLSGVAGAVKCSRLAFYLIGDALPNFAERAAQAIGPICQELIDDGVKPLLSLSTPPANRGRTLKFWRPMDPQEWRDLIAMTEGLALSFSAGDCIWQNIDYLKLLPGIVNAVDHVEANDVEINRDLLVDSGLFGPLFWRYRRPGKGQVDWRQLIEALKLYDYKGTFSIHLDDEFVEDSYETLGEALDESIKFLKPLVKD
jgi:sugar phosphate isomerase/epimerase